MNYGRKVNTLSLLENMVEGETKLYVIYRALQIRGRLKALFEEGAYTPLAVEGKYSENVIIFYRKKGVSYVVVVVPRFLTDLIKVDSVWDSVDWADTSIILPKDPLQVGQTSSPPPKLGAQKMGGFYSATFWVSSH